MVAKAKLLGGSCIQSQSSKFPTSVSGFCFDVTFLQAPISISAFPAATSGRHRISDPQHFLMTPTATCVDFNVLRRQPISILIRRSLLAKSIKATGSLIRKLQLIRLDLEK